MFETIHVAKIFLNIIIFRSTSIMIVFNQKIFCKSSNAKSVIKLIKSTLISIIYNINIKTLNSQHQFLFDLLQKQSINETNSISIFQHKIFSTRSKNNFFCLLFRTISEFELTQT